MVTEAVSIVSVVDTPNGTLMKCERCGLTDFTGPVYPRLIPLYPGNAGTFEIDGDLVERLIRAGARTSSELSEVLGFTPGYVGSLIFSLGERRVYRSRIHCCSCGMRGIVYRA